MSNSQFQSIHYNLHFFVLPIWNFLKIEEEKRCNILCTRLSIFAIPIVIIVYGEVDVNPNVQFTFKFVDTLETVHLK